MKKIFSALFSIILCLSLIGISAAAASKISTTAVQDGFFYIQLTPDAGIESATVFNESNTAILQQTLDDVGENGAMNFKVPKNAVYTVKTYQNSETPTETFIVDKKIPVIKSLSYNEGYTNDAVMVSFVVEDDSDVTVKIENNGNTVDFNSSGTSFAFSAEENGTYTISAEDASQNKAEDLSVKIEKIDREEPVITADPNGNEDLGSSGKLFKYTVTDNAGIGSVYVNGKKTAVFDDSSIKTEYEGEFLSTDGSEIVIEATDLAGNVTEKSFDPGIVDFEEPVIVKNLAVSDIKDSSVTASITAQDDTDLTYEWFLSGGTNDDFLKIDGKDSTITISNLSRGVSYTAKVVITDAAGNSVTDTVSFATANSLSGSQAPKDNTLLYLLLGGVSLAVVCAAVILIILFRSKKKNNDDDDDDDFYDDDDDDFAPPNKAPVQQNRADYPRQSGRNAQSSYNNPKQFNQNQQQNYTSQPLQPNTHQDTAQFAGTPVPNPENNDNDDFIDISKL